MQSNAEKRASESLLFLFILFLLFFLGLFFFFLFVFAVHLQGHSGQSSGLASRQPLSATRYEKASVTVTLCSDANL